MVGYGIICMFLGNTAASLLFGRLTKYTGRTVVFAIGGVLAILSLAVIFLSGDTIGGATSSKTALYLILMAVAGMVFAVCTASIAGKLESG